MDIFASQAQEIKDNQEPSDNSRYSDTSNNYAAGFKFDNKLNSAILNGILHRITSRLKELSHCPAEKIGINLDRPYRYCSLDEIQKNNPWKYSNYLHKRDWENFKKYRLEPYLLKVEYLSDFFNKTPPSEKAFIPGTTAKRARGVFFGTNLPPRLLTEQDYQSYSAKDPTKLPAQGIPVLNEYSALLFEISGETVEKVYVKVDIWSSEEQLSDVEIRCSLRPILNKNVLKFEGAAQVIPVVFFRNQMSYRGKNIPINTPYTLSKCCRIVWKGSKILILDGIEEFAPSTHKSTTLRNFFLKEAK